MRQAQPGLSRRLKGAYSWNDPFNKVAEQACGKGVILVTKPCEANSRAAAKANPIRPRYPNGSGQSVEADEACHRW